MASLPSSIGGPYGVREIRSLYPAVTDNHLRYLEKWGLVRKSNKPHARREYSFADLTTIKQVAGELERGTPLRLVLRSLLAERQGQLELNFVDVHVNAAPPRAKASTLDPQKPLLNATTPAPLSAAAVPYAADDPQAALASKYFLEGSRLDDGEEGNYEAAAAAYRRAPLFAPGLGAGARQPAK